MSELPKPDDYDPWDGPTIREYSDDEIDDIKSTWWFIGMMTMGTIMTFFYLMWRLSQ